MEHTVRAPRPACCARFALRVGDQVAMDEELMDFETPTRPSP